MSLYQTPPDSILINGEKYHIDTAVSYTHLNNDGLTVNYASAQTEEQLIGSVYDQVVEILPVELVNLEVGS